MNRGNWNRFSGAGLLLAAYWAVAVGMPGCNGNTRDELSLAERSQQARAISDPTSRASKLIGLARDQQAARDNNGAQQSLRSAKEACGEISENLSRAQAFTKLATAQAELGGGAAASDSIKEVRRLLDKIGDLEQLVKIRAALALIFSSHLDNPVAAQYELREAEETSQSIAETPGRVRALLSLASTSHTLEASDEAARLLDAARQTADDEEDAKKRADSLAEIAATLANWQRDDEADALFAESLQLAREIEDPWQRGYALVNIAETMISTGRNSSAGPALDDADQAADQIRDGSMQRELREIIARYR